MGGKYKQFGPWNVKQTEQEGGGGAAEGRGCKPWRARKELVGDWDHCDIPDKHFILLFLLF